MEWDLNESASHVELANKPKLSRISTVNKKFCQCLPVVTDYPFHDTYHPRSWNLHCWITFEISEIPNDFSVMKEHGGKLKIVTRHISHFCKLLILCPIHILFFALLLQLSTKAYPSCWEKLLMPLHCSNKTLHFLLKGNDSDALKAVHWYTFTIR